MSGKHNSATESVDGQPTRAHRSIIPLVNDITAHETRMGNEKRKEIGLRQPKVDSDGLAAPDQHLFIFNQVLIENEINSVSG